MCRCEPRGIPRASCVAHASTRSRRAPRSMSRKTRERGFRCHEALFVDRAFRRACRRSSRDRRDGSANGSNPKKVAGWVCLNRSATYGQVSQQGDIISFQTKSSARHLLDRYLRAIELYGSGFVERQQLPRFHASALVAPRATRGTRHETATAGVREEPPRSARASRRGGAGAGGPSRVRRVPRPVARRRSRISVASRQRPAGRVVRRLGEASGLRLSGRVASAPARSQSSEGAEASSPTPPRAETRARPTASR